MTEYIIKCAMGCGKVVGKIQREEGDAFGEFYHCAACMTAFDAEQKELYGEEE